MFIFFFLIYISKNATYIAENDVYISKQYLLKVGKKIEGKFQISEMKAITKIEGKRYGMKTKKK